MNGRQTGVIVTLLTAASVALTLGFACALPLAAFAVMAAMLFAPAAAVGSVLAVWLANQIVGFGFLHYPTDASTLAWGLALGVIGLLSLGAAFAVLSRLHGLVGIVVSFLAAFVVYEGADLSRLCPERNGRRLLHRADHDADFSDQRRRLRRFHRRSRALAAFRPRERDRGGSRPPACLMPIEATARRRRRLLSWRRGAYGPAAKARHGDAGRS